MLARVVHRHEQHPCACSWAWLWAGSWVPSWACWWACSEAYRRAWLLSQSQSGVPPVCASACPPPVATHPDHEPRVTRDTGGELGVLGPRAAQPWQRASFGEGEAPPPRVAATRAHGQPQAPWLASAPGGLGPDAAGLQHQHGAPFVRQRPRAGRSVGWCGRLMWCGHTCAGRRDDTATHVW